MNELAAWTQWIAQSVAQIVSKRRCRPRATYRLQFGPEAMTFQAAAGIVPYLDELGISHVYASPYLKTRAGSGNGYAIVDYTQLNPELGDQNDYQALIAALHDRGMGQIFDTVPNHMCAAPGENMWWTDVLENGPASPHAAYFDIDWRPVQEELRNRLLLPILGDQYGKVLESGDLKLEYREGAFSLRYYQSVLPIDPRTYRAILCHRPDVPKAALPADSQDLRELESIITAIEHLPERSETDPARIAERLREKEVIKQRLGTLSDRTAEIAAYIDSTVAAFNGTPGDAPSYDDLDRLLDAQVYRLTHWKAAADEINYRRFFDINELAALCMESPDVFDKSHRLVFDLLARGDVDGLRIDHIDGLYDPMDYLQRLQNEYLVVLGKALYDRAIESSLPESHAAGAIAPTTNPPGDPPPWNDIKPLFLASLGEMLSAGGDSLPLYVVVEKILAGEEKLPEQWPLAGTTGYDFLNSVNGLFVDSAGYAQAAKIYDRFIDQRPDFREVIEQAKILIFRIAMSSELQLLAHRLNRISERHRRTRDFTLNSLRIALRDILVCFPVYRTYICDGQVSERDRQVVCRAVAHAKRRNRASDAAVFDFIRDLLLLESPPDLDSSGCHERQLFVGRVQQVTSPLMAKGVEDTAFYRCFPLASLNEVGSAPGRGTVTVEEFHRHNQTRQATFPRSLLGSTTHDTKRGEDVRARISVLAEIPHSWRKEVNRWARLNRRHRRQVEAQPAPSRNDEYLFYQTLVGIWPLTPPHGRELGDLAARVTEYMEKATHEAKEHTSWINPHVEYETAVRGFVAAALDEKPKNRFLAVFRQFHEQIVDWGLYTALSQLLLKLTSPGVPDIYQGQELWDFSLVDPDNRRPVDFQKRRKMLNELRSDADRNDGALHSLARQLSRNPRDPRLKLFATWRALEFRRRHAELFEHGDYIPLTVTGAQASHVCAFARNAPSTSGTGRQKAIVIVPRLLASLSPSTNGTPVASPPLGNAVWTDTCVNLGEAPPPCLKNVLTGRSVAMKEAILPVATALEDFPVAVLALR